MMSNDVKDIVRVALRLLVTGLDPINTSLCSVNRRSGFGRLGTKAKAKDGIIETIEAALTYIEVEKGWAVWKMDCA